MANNQIARAKSAADIINRAASNPSTKEVEVPQWECTLVIQKLRKDRQAQIREATVKMDPKGKKVVKADQVLWEKLVFQACVVEPPFSMEEVDALWQTDADAVDVVMGEVLTFSGLSKEAEEQAEAEFPEQS